MPDPKLLKVGDKVRILCVPDGDLQSLKYDPIEKNITVRVLQWMVGKEFIVYEVTEYGAWVGIDNFPELGHHQHTMILADQKSWEYAG